MLPRRADPEVSMIEEKRGAMFLQGNWIVFRELEDLGRFASSSSICDCRSAETDGKKPRPTRASAQRMSFWKSTMMMRTRIRTVFGVVAWFALAFVVCGVKPIERVCLAPVKLSCVSRCTTGCGNVSIRSCFNFCGRECNMLHWVWNSAPVRCSLLSSRCTRPV